MTNVKSQEVNKPVVSVIIATYNRSNVLEIAIQTVLWQTFTAWELIVVGDACTDDTAEVVAKFEDERIQFVNLETNIGEQSGPNNHGMALAKGDYIAFINHDDLWFPDHLEKSLAYLKHHHLDLVMSVSVGIFPTHQIILGVTTEPMNIATWSPASTWLFKKEVFTKVGDWHFFRDVWLIPSQDWLKRCWRLKIKSQFSPYLTVLCLFSGARKNVYKNRDYKENLACFQRLEVDYHAYREELLITNLASYHKKSFSFRRLVRKRLAKFGIIPNEIKNFFKYYTKGGFIDALRLHRGLPNLKK